MKVLNLNLFVYPDSVGGAAVVAEKLAWGLISAGHEVTNVFLSRRADGQDLSVHETPFGRSVAINNVFPSPANRFSNPPAASLLSEIAEIVQPDLIVVHAAQNMGIHDFLRDPKWLSRTRIIAHDFFWACIQGFRTLPDGSRCERPIGNVACRGCAWYPGLIEETYRSSWQILREAPAVIFPSRFLHDGYVGTFHERPDNFHVVSNPDKAELIVAPGAPLPEPAGLAAKQAGKTVYAFVGGPGETKGWRLVSDFIAASGDGRLSDSHVVLFDAGRAQGTPWYGEAAPGSSVADPFHWSYAAHALSQVDAILMPSRVQESFGLAAREILSLGGKSLVRRSGALAEMEGYADVFIAHEEDDSLPLAQKMASEDQTGKAPWRPTSIEDYTQMVLSVA